MQNIKIDYDTKFKNILQRSYVNPMDDLEHPPIALSKGFTNSFAAMPIALSTYGNFSFVQAPPKSKKTFFLSLMAAAYLNGNNGRGENEFFGEMMSPKTRGLVHYDTEQSSFHAQKVFKRVLNMSGTCDNYFTYALREYDPKERLEFIDWHLNTQEDIGFVVIDGIADLIYDVNDLTESSKLVQYLMQWTEELDIHIVCAIHSNYNSDKPTGHLGSFLEKKTETQIQLEPMEDNVVIVKCKRTRNFPFEEFAFKVGKDGLPRILDEIPELVGQDKYLRI